MNFEGISTSIAQFPDWDLCEEKGTIMSFTSTNTLVFTSTNSSLFSSGFSFFLFHDLRYSHLLWSKTSLVLSEILEAPTLTLSALSFMTFPLKSISCSLYSATPPFVFPPIMPETQFFLLPISRNVKSWLDILWTDLYIFYEETFVSLLWHVNNMLRTIFDFEWYWKINGNRTLPQAVQRFCTDTKWHFMDNV